ncbi:hypothetical protein M6B38_304655 [Iris pallida]|uniref:Uncharacterized protein n=1 Tax=Iris pallida TaxID=29817 RepID=A0AAX6HMM5_IRIPA|nr:hypothetical protein M6B38_304655 [Iris pallida]
MRRNVAFCWRTLHLARQQSCGLYAAHMRPCGLMRLMRLMRSMRLMRLMRLMRSMRLMRHMRSMRPKRSMRLILSLWDLN